MRIEVSVPGIRKERGKLPPPTTLGALRLALPLAGRPLICGELGGPALCEPVTGTQVGAPVATAHPVSAKTKKSTTIGSRQRRCRRPRCTSHSARRTCLGERGYLGCREREIVVFGD